MTSTDTKVSTWQGWLIVALVAGFVALGIVSLVTAEGGGADPSSVGSTVTTTTTPSPPTPTITLDEHEHLMAEQAYRHRADLSEAYDDGYSDAYVDAYEAGTVCGALAAAEWQSEALYQTMLHFYEGDTEVLAERMWLTAERVCPELLDWHFPAEGEAA